MSKLSATQQVEWSEFMQIIPRLQAYQIHTQIDVVQKSEEFEYLFNVSSINPTESKDAAKLIVVLLVDSFGYCVLLENNDIAIDHENIRGPFKNVLLKLLGDKPWFVWDESQDTRMFLVLE
jgi:hypothetical protein